MLQALFRPNNPEEISLSLRINQLSSPVMQPCQEIPTPQLPALTIPTAVAIKQHITSLWFPWHPFLKGELDQQQTARMPFPPLSQRLLEREQSKCSISERLSCRHFTLLQATDSTMVGQGWHQPSTEIKSQRVQFSPSPVPPSAVSLTPPV